MHVALSTIVPFVVGLGATQTAMVIGERYGMDTLRFVLVGWCVALLASAIGSIGSYSLAKKRFFLSRPPS